MPLWQYGVLFAVGLSSALASTVCSTLVIRLSLRKLDKIYHRTLLSLSLCDVGFSIGNILQFFLIPHVSWVGNVWAQGNNTSCSCIALFYTFFAMAGPLYNWLLVSYFYLTIARSWQDPKISLWIERPLHIFVVILVIVPVMGWALDKIVFHELAMICVPGRGLFFAIFPGLVVSLAALGSTITAIATNRFVGKRLKRSRRHSFHCSLTVVSDRTIREANIQSYLYCFAFLNSFVWILLITVLSHAFDDETIRSRMFPARLIMYIFVPLQGVLNFAIYVRPHTLRWKRSVPDSSWTWAVWQVAVKGLPPPPPPISSPQIDHIDDPSEEVTSKVVHDEYLSNEFDCGPSIAYRNSSNMEDP